ncbi:MAG TPA: hypothetical protein DCS82_01980 [Rhodospirillaceae bacterium]|mgnify:CR=1 FL=1|nr:hypothetical protein [Rhodospirillaceae bacterium]HAT34460.1 hypothetical protein [Rhodospirillaceae bacterium]
MTDDLFSVEEDLLDAAKAYLEAGHFKNPDAKKEFASFVKAYGRLLRQTKRMVRISDRSAAELRDLTKSLDEKNEMLEGLSEKLSKYLSPQVYASIFSGERDVELTTERKKLTVFFSDIKDFTATTDGMEPEDLTALLNSYLTEMSEIALKHGATIDKYIGDAMMLFFGDPETEGVKEDARRCVRMAIEMQERMVSLEEEWRAEGYSNPFKMRIGINTGYCNVGNFGSVDRMDYTIIGGEVNLAARLEGLAEPGGITLSYETYAQVRDMVRAKKNEPIQVKGIQRKVVPYAVQGLSDESDARFFRKEKKGMRVFVDLKGLTKRQRQSAIKDMKEIIKRLDH